METECGDQRGRYFLVVAPPPRSRCTVDTPSLVVETGLMPPSAVMRRRLQIAQNDAQATPQ
jgi:hypothetical protein